MKNNKQPEINLNLNVRGIPQSATLEINERSNELIKSGRKVYKLGLGQSPFPVPKPVVDELKKNAFQKDYLAVKGLYELRTAVADYHYRKHGVCATAENVLIGPGSKELMFLLQFVFYGDLLIPIPSWVSYAPQAQIIGRHVRWLRTKPKNNYKLTAKEIIEHCESDPNKPRIVILNYPANPTGLTYKDSELREIAKTAKKFKLILLSDEIYGELHHQGKHTSIAKYYQEGTIISSGLSKWCGAGGWRLGTFTFPQSLSWLLDAMAAVASETFTATSAPIQYAAVRAFQGGEEIEDYLWKCRWILEKLGNSCSDILNSFGIYTPVPDGAFYLFSDFKKFKDKFYKNNIETDKQMCKKLLEDTGVAILPGSAFGCREEDFTARLAYVNFDGVKTLSVASRLNNKDKIDELFIKKYCYKTIEAINLISNWAKNILEQK
ncbi:MAG TPA: aminotransferase class I/II-fold pyridoxal phosphate-dependent enzyme [Ignavibacteriaceae bacterium]|nr:aminotransferase class I/II-fold pyridoxal phosphate-dependent enzyme [Ignavibacteriaceae bacterium]